MNQSKNPLIDFISKQWLLIVSGSGLLLTSIYAGHLPSYSTREVEVLFVLLVLFVVINGLRQSGLIARMSQHLDTGRFIALKLVLVTFLLSMFLTNDVALMVVVPITLALDITGKSTLVILLALAANAGSALTPIGNPQNLYIYWFYELTAVEFVRSIAPFSLVFLLILTAASLVVKTERKAVSGRLTATADRSCYVYGFLLAGVLLTVLHVVPVPAAGIVIVYALFFDRKALRVDYALLLSFFLFFGLADNIRSFLASDIQQSGHIFLFSALASQLISNVPVTLLFAKLTTQWDALLWGVNAGGFGSLFGSLANLIVYGIYIKSEDRAHIGRFTAQFLLMGYAAFFIAIGLYFLLQHGG